mgnify:CR=1 FL=1
MNQWKLINHTFKFREGDTDEKGGCTFIGGSWKDVTTDELFKGKRVVLFSLPGAFTPTCSGQQLPTYDTMFSDMTKEHIDDVYCISVNDGFVMGAWFKDLGIKKVKWLADGNGVIADSLGMLVEKSNLGFGMRSWRYAAIIRNGIVEAMFDEDGFEDNCETDPYKESTPEMVLKYLIANK